MIAGRRIVKILIYLPGRLAHRWRRVVRSGGNVEYAVMTFGAATDFASTEFRRIANCRIVPFLEAISAELLSFCYVSDYVV